MQDHLQIQRFQFAFPTLLPIMLPFPSPTPHSTSPFSALSMPFGIYPFDVLITHSLCLQCVSCFLFFDTSLIPQDPSGIALTLRVLLWLSSLGRVNCSLPYAITAFGINLEQRTHQSIIYYVFVSFLSDCKLNRVRNSVFRALLMADVK